MGNKTKFTASEAIEAIDGMHRKRFYQMVNNGEISYTAEDQGSKQIKLFDAVLEGRAGDSVIPSAS